MSQADELLDSISEEGQYSGSGSFEEHIVIGRDRYITVPESLQKIAVQFDHDVETVTFDCPRYWDDWDMSTGRIYVNYMRSDGAIGMCRTTNVIVDEINENLIHFDWTLSKNTTLTSGDLTFLVCANDVDEDGNLLKHWNSELNNDMYISEGLEVATSSVKDYPDIITWVLSRMDQVETLDKRILVGDIEVKTADPEEDAAVEVECVRGDDGLYKTHFKFKIPQGIKGDMPEGIVEANTRRVLNFFAGTQAEFDAYDGADKDELIFIDTDHSALDDIDQAFSELEDGTRVVGEATHATSADTATNATNAVNANNASHANNADNAAHATSADTATNATNAVNANHANSADTAQTATNAVNADKAIADILSGAETVKKAYNAQDADHSSESDWAESADDAKNAGYVGGWFSVDEPTNESYEGTYPKKGVVLTGQAYIILKEDLGAVSGSTAYRKYRVSGDGAYFKNPPCDLDAVVYLADGTKFSARIYRENADDVTTSYIEVLNTNAAKMSLNTRYKVTYALKTDYSRYSDEANIAKILNPKVALSKDSGSTIDVSSTGKGLYLVLYKNATDGDFNGSTATYKTEVVYVGDSNEKSESEHVKVENHIMSFTSTWGSSCEFEMAYKIAGV